MVTYGAYVMTRRWHLRFALLATTATCFTAIAGGLNPAAAADLTRYAQQQLIWRKCAGEMQCAKLTVPRDYADLAAGDIQIALSRVPHSGTTFQGSIVVNPGGPGGSGTDFASTAAAIVAPEVSQQFDIVGFDPRGVAASAPVTCMNGSQTTRWLLADPTPDTRIEQDILMGLAREISAGCLQYSPRIAPFISTVICPEIPEPSWPHGARWRGGSKFKRNGDIEGTIRRLSRRPCAFRQGLRQPKQLPLFR